MKISRLTPCYEDGARTRAPRLCSDGERRESVWLTSRCSPRAALNRKPEQRDDLARLAEHQWNRMIQLVGPGGAGKTTAGAALAQRLGVQFIDLDAEFALRNGDISAYLDTHGYDAYAERNVALYLALTPEPRRPGVVALSSGFMTYRQDVHPGYVRCRRQIASSPITFVLLPSLQVETCVAEIVRRQLQRSFARAAAREEQVIRARFPVYVSLSARKVDTMRPVDAVVAELVVAVAAQAS